MVTSARAARALACASLLIAILSISSSVAVGAARSADVSAHVVGLGKYVGRTSQHRAIAFHVGKGNSAACQYAHGRNKAHRDCLYDPNDTYVAMHCPTVGTATLYSGFNANAALIATTGKLSETNNAYTSGSTPIAVEKIHVTIGKSVARGALTLKETVDNGSGGTETCHSGSVTFTLHRR
jgi:hypothetical protein